MKNAETFYKAFEDRWRGTPENIKARQAIYLPLAELSHRFYPDSPFLDLGCGRGEWLQLLKERDIPAQGIDGDEKMVAFCRNLDLSVEKNDILRFLQQAPSETFGMVTLFHVVEHLSFDHLNEVMEHIYRVLRPGGILIVETPNPENIRISTLNFWMDPTHIRPLPPHLLDFLLEWEGFIGRRIWRLHEDHDLLEQKYASIGQVLEGASPDYAVVSQKQGLPELTEAYLALPGHSGLCYRTLEIRFEQRMDDMISRQQASDNTIRLLDERIEWTIKTLENMQRQFEEMHHLTEDIRAHYFAIVNSRSWRITRPFREGKQFIKSMLIHFKVTVDRHPKLRVVLLKLLYRMPWVYSRLRRIWSDVSEVSQDKSSGTPIPDLTPRGRRIYREMMEELSKGVHR